MVEKNNRFIFDKQMTTSIKGVAICIMLFHHFFGFPNWIEGGLFFMEFPLGEQQ